MRLFGVNILAILMILIFIYSPDNSQSITAYSNVSFMGTSAHLNSTQGRCHELDYPVKSVRNDLAHVHVMLFSDPYCTDPVAVISAMQQDDGTRSDSYANTFTTGRTMLNLLGQRGARSYRTTPSISEADQRLSQNRI